MTPPEADRQLLAGCLAVRVGLLDFGRLTDACSSGSSDRLADRLVERGWLTPDDLKAIDHLLHRSRPRLTPDELRLVESYQPGGATREHVAAPVTLTHAPGEEGHPITTRVYHPGGDPTATRSTAEHDRSTATPDDPNQTLTHDPDAAHPDGAIGGERRYERTRLHATGGMGQVWVARDSAVGRDVALKELRPDRANGAAARARFVTEARITGRLEHPNIVPVYEYAPPAPGRPPFYTMRLVAGRTLAKAGTEYHERRAAGAATAVEFRELLAAFLGVCNAVAYAHGRGVLHRDLKGANVVLGTFGEVVVLDWGLAKYAGDGPDADLGADAAGHRETHSGTILGTPSYMSPEQAAGQADRIDTRTDVYGLGAVLYELLTGRPPFTGPDTPSVLVQVASAAPPAPDTLAPGTPRPLEAICLKALAKKPEERYAAATELGDDVRRFLADEPVSARREPVLERVGRRLRKNRTLAAALAVAAAVLIPALAVFAEFERRSAKTLAGEKRETADAKALAEVRLEQVVDTWYTQLITVQNELDRQAVSPKFRLRLLDSAKERLAEALRGQPRTRTTDHMRHELHRRLAFAHGDAGDFAAAEREWGEARRVADARFQEDPDGPDSRRDVAAALVTLAEIRTGQGKWDDALVALTEAAAHIAAHATAHPNDARTADDRVNLAEQRSRVLLRANRDARAAFAEALRLAREAATARPADAHAQMRLLHTLRSAAIEAQTRRAPAAVFLSEALTLAAAQLKRDPDNHRLLAEKATVLSLHGDEAAPSDVNTARAWFTQARAIREKLARPADAPPDAIIGFADVYQRLGDLSYNARNPATAVIEYGQAARQLERVVVANPTLAVRESVGNILARLGAVDLALGNTDDARKHLSRSEEHRRKLAEESPADSNVAQARAESLRLLGDLEKSPTVLDFAAAERHYRDAATLLRKFNATGQLLHDSNWGAEYCRRVLNVIADPALAKSFPPEQAFPLLIARMRVRAQAGDADGAARTGDLVRQLRPDVGAYIAGAARGYALAVKAEKNPTAKEGYAATATALLAEAGLGSDTPADADFDEYRKYRVRPIPVAAP